MATQNPTFDQPPNHVPEEPTMASIVNRVRFTDTFLASALENIGANPYSLVPGGPGMGALDPQLYARYLLDIGTSIGRTGLLKFVATQTALHALNVENAKVFDPGYFVERAPILNGLTRITLDTETHSDIVSVKEEALVPAMEQALTVLDKTGLPMVQTDVDGMRDLNTAYSENRYSDGAMFSVGGFVDAALLDTRTADSLAAAQLLENDSSLGVFKLKKNAFFDDGKVKLGKAQQPRAQFSARAAKRPVTEGSSAALARSSFSEGIVPAAFKQDGIDGVVRTLGDARPSSVVDDDDAYVPLSFTDLRKKGNETRTVFFRPFITSFSESFAPEMGNERFFGRVDPVVKYTGTARMISLGFDLHAFAPEDLRAIYQKLHWLTSLVYPEIDADFLFKTGPVCKLRVGDMVGSSAGGQSGVLQSLDFDYTDALWELKKGVKVVRTIQVSLSFLALHGGPLGLFDGRFGVLGHSAPEQVQGDSLTARAQNAAAGSAIIVDKLRGFGDPEVL